MLPLVVVEGQLIGPTGSLSCWSCCPAGSGVVVGQTQPAVNSLLHVLLAVVDVCAMGLMALPFVWFSSNLNCVCACASQISVEDFVAVDLVAHFAAAFDFMQEAAQQGGGSPCTGLPPCSAYLPLI